MSRPTPVRSLLLLALVAGFTFLAGCESTETAVPAKITLQPVSNPVPPKPAGVYDPSEVDQQPVASSQARPVYARELRRAGVQGEAVILFTVKADGTVSDASIIKAVDLRLGQAALAAVLKWRFEPGLVKGVPVAVWMKVPIEFSL